MKEDDGRAGPPLLDMNTHGREASHPRFKPTDGGCEPRSTMSATTTCGPTEGFRPLPNAAAVDLLDEGLNLVVTDPSVLVGGLDTVESISDAGEFETNYADAFANARG